MYHHRIAQIDVALVGLVVLIVKESRDAFATSKARNPGPFSIANNGSCYRLMMTENSSIYRPQEPDTPAIV